MARSVSAFRSVGCTPTVRASGTWPPTKHTKQRWLVPPVLLRQCPKLNCVLRHRTRALLECKEPILCAPRVVWTVKDLLKARQELNVWERTQLRTRAGRLRPGQSSPPQKTDNIINFLLIQGEQEQMLKENEPALKKETPSFVEVPVKRLGVASIGIPGTCGHARSSGIVGGGNMELVRCTMCCKRSYMDCINAAMLWRTMSIACSWQPSMSPWFVRPRCASAGSIWSDRSVTERVEQDPSAALRIPMRRTQV